MSAKKETEIQRNNFPGKWIPPLGRTHAHIYPAHLVVALSLKSTPKSPTHGRYMRILMAAVLRVPNKPPHICFKRFIYNYMILHQYISIYRATRFRYLNTTLIEQLHISSVGFPLVLDPVSHRVVPMHRFIILLKQESNDRFLPL